MPRMTEGEKPLLVGRHLLVATLITLTYLVIGAAIFYGLEHNYAVLSRTNFEKRQAGLLQQGNFSSSQLTIINELMTMAAQEPYSPYSAAWEDEEKDELWSFGESLYFTLVTISTVGYGDMSPQTDSGKVFLIFFTIVGIPLMITVNLSLGGYVIKGVFLLMLKINSWAKWGLERRPRVAVELCLLGGVLLLSFLLTLLFSGILATQHGWDYFNSFYFTWTTLTTIGYGDLTIENNHYVTASILLIVLLALSFAAGSALVGLLTRIFRFDEIAKNGSEIGSEVHLVDEKAPGSMGMVDIDGIIGEHSKSEKTKEMKESKMTGGLDQNGDIHKLQEVEL